MQAAREQAAALTRAAYETAAAEGLLPAGPVAPFTAEEAGDTRRGDWVCAFALHAAGAAGRNANEIAAALAARLVLEGSYFCAAEAVPPGFLNFTLGSRFFVEALEAVEGGDAAGDQRLRQQAAALAAALPPGPFAALSRDADRFFASAPASVRRAVDADLASRQDTKNPFYRVRYAHARACRLVEMAAERGAQVLPAREIDVTILCTGAERGLMKTLAALPEAVRLAVRDGEPSRVTGCMIALADGFFCFYHEARICSGPPPRVAARLKLTDAVRIGLAEGLGLLGVGIEPKG